jgi:hypothetical protein
VLRVGGRRVVRGGKFLKQTCKGRGVPQADMQGEGRCKLSCCCV